MQHQLIALLYGHGGDGDALGDIPLAHLHSSEREAVERMARAGSLFADVSRVAERVSAGLSSEGLPSPSVAPSRKGKTEGGSLAEAPIDSNMKEPTTTAVELKHEQATESKTVLQLKLGSVAAAVARRVRETVCAQYAGALARLETRIATDGDRVPLSVMLIELDKFIRLFPHLSALLNTLAARVLHGLAINQHLYSLANSTGVKDLVILYVDLLNAANAVLGRFLVAWCVYGKIADPFKEFFVASVSVKVADSFHRSAKNRWQSEFTLVDTLVPSFIPHNVAQDVLFVGKAVSAIQESSTRKASIADSLVESSISELSILVKSADFKPLEFQVALKRIKKVVAKILWEVVVVDENLLQHLEACRNYFLMGRGDFYITFIEEVEKLCLAAAARLSIVTEQDLTLLVMRVSRMLGAGGTSSIVGGVGSVAEDSLLRNFRVRKVGEKESQSQNASLYSGAFIGVPIRLEYNVKWPLDLIFSQKDMVKYNDIFSFLIFLKRTQMRLQRLWASMKGKRSGRMGEGQDGSDAWALRQSMMYFVDSVWSYVQMDVLAAEYHKLLRAITQPSYDSATASVLSTPDFEDIQAAHSQFLDACLAGCFLDGAMKKFVGGTLRSALGTCDAFVGIVERGVGVGGFSGGYATKDLAHVREEFETHSTFMFRIFSGVNDTTSKKSSHLDALLLRLDHNLYYSTR
ncbi:gamma-tubulin complex component protein [Chytriomyces sp. MP71]|nr:gamma-tubulin complex component protein [Chytriomyces sp. MP71]